ncbi:MAG: hypothetical protein HY921_09960 [Elusimicrobia bacterium]|nr:hypothetical protein [Elusimicrobiota bacterium]
MNGLWADSWFYVSAAGFLVSSVFFMFLLRQYRIAVESEEAHEPAPQPEIKPIAAALKPVPEAVAPLSLERPVPKVAAEPSVPAPAPAPNLKPQLEKLEKEISTLKALVMKQAEASQDILKRLNDMGARLPSPAPVSVQAPTASDAAGPARSLGDKLPGMGAPAPAAAPAAVELKAEAPAQEPSKLPSVQPEASPADEEKPGRKGPVWPI